MEIKMDLKRGDTIRIGETKVSIGVKRSIGTIRGRLCVWLAFDAPRDIRIVRGEIKREKYYRKDKR